MLQLVAEFFTELVEALPVVWLMAQTRLESVRSRLGFAVVAGLLAARVLGRNSLRRVVGRVAASASAVAA